MQTRVIILAAGEGKRMKSSIPKVLHTLCGRAMVGWVMEAARGIDAHPVVVVGHGRDAVMAALEGRARFAVQESQRGTGHAVMAARDAIPEDGAVVVAAADMPLLRSGTLEALAAGVTRDGFAAMVLTAIAEDPAGYGRVLRDGSGDVAGIVEHRDATPAQREIREINTSVYCFRGNLLRSLLDRLTCDNDQGEYYLTDVIGLMVRAGHRVGALRCAPDEALGINDRAQLAQAEAALRRRINEAHMREGVRIIDPAATYIDADVAIGGDTVVYPGNVLESGTRIGSGATLYPGNRISASRVGDGVTIQSSVLVEAQVGNGATIGPFAYLRPGSKVGAGCRIGDFVELKNAVIGDGTKVPHLTYVGDAEIGERANIGCGAVFVNYDGHRKHRTTVGDGAFIGCNTNLVAPVTVGRGAYTAAGSTITEDVPDDALAIARSRQTNKDGWARRRRSRYEEEV